MLRNLTLLAAILAAVPAAAGGPRMRFDVPEPFQVGPQHYGPGRISVRSVGVDSTRASLIEVWVDRSCLGAFEATRVGGAVPPRRDEALFSRNDEGHLVMVGFRVAGAAMGTYRFDSPGHVIPADSTLAEARTPISRR